MAELTERERILRTYRRQEVDRIPLLDRAWNGTQKRWYAEGLPAGVPWEKHFGFDRWMKVQPSNSPRFEVKVLEKSERYTIQTTEWGLTRKVFNELDSTPEVLDYHFNDSEKWEEAKKAMLTYHDDRIPWKWLRENHAGQGGVVASRRS